MWPAWWNMTSPAICIHTYLTRDLLGVKRVSLRFRIALACLGIIVQCSCVYSILLALLAVETALL